MISGFVDDDLNPLIEVVVFGKGRRKRTVIATVDTGFTDYLLLPLDLIGFLKLTALPSEAVAILADGTSIQSPYYVAEVMWDGVLKRIPVLGTEGNALVGMSLMRGYDLNVAVEEGGPVTLTKRAEATPGS
jgi:predicted aspartyl protease